MGKLIAPIAFMLLLATVYGLSMYALVEILKSWFGF